MEAILRNVKDIEGSDRRSLENVLGGRLDDNQQLLIHVLNIGTVPSEEARRAGIQTAAAIAERGRAHAATQNITAEEADQAIDEAIQHVRQRRST